MHPFSSGRYCNLFWVTFSLWWIPEVVGTFLQRAKAGDRTKVQDRGSYLVLIVLMFAGIGLAFLFADILPRATITWNQIPVFFVGIVFMLAGVAFRWYAIRTLGRFFTRNVATHADQKVVQHGPYTLIRQPYCLCYARDDPDYAGFGIGDDQLGQHASSR